MIIDLATSATTIDADRLLRGTINIVRGMVNLNSLEEHSC